MTDNASSLGYYNPTFDPKYSQIYVDAMKMDPISDDYYIMQYNHSIIDDDNVNDSIKVKVLYNELMKLKTQFSITEKRLLGEINYLNASYSKVSNENKKLSDEITSIKQALYFG